MSWKLSALAIAFLGVSGLALASEQQSPRPRNDASALSSDDASGLAAAKKKPTDQELIAKQKTCPVTDEPLGSMGKPVKVVVKGRTVFLCCAGCKKKLLADPDKYLKKLDEQK